MGLSAGARQARGPSTALLGSFKTEKVKERTLGNGAFIKKIILIYLYRNGH